MVKLFLFLLMSILASEASAKDPKNSDLNWRLMQINRETYLASPDKSVEIRVQISSLQKPKIVAWLNDLPENPHISMLIYEGTSKGTKKIYKVQYAALYNLTSKKTIGTGIWRYIDSEQAENKIPQPEWRWSKGKVEIFDSLFPSTTNIEL
jgi:hypothetical protein